MTTEEMQRQIESMMPTPKQIVENIDKKLEEKRLIMTQYIDKAAVIAEINRVLNSYDPNQITSGRYALVDLRDFLNTLEVKEVNLEKEIDEVIHNYKLNNNRHTSICSADIEWIANHFFELGLKAQKGGEE